MGEEMTHEEAIEILGGIRACYNIFDDYEKCKYSALSIAIQALKDEPVRHSHWIRNDNGTYSCNNCYSWIPDEQHYYAKYCLYCGAKMDGGESDDSD